MLQAYTSNLSLGGGSSACVQQDAPPSGATTNLKVTSLSCGKHQIPDALPRLLGQYGKLQVLQLPGCCIGDVGALALASVAGQYLRQLHTLQLPGNYITATGAQKLADASFKHLTALNLSGNYLAAEGAAALAAASWRPGLQQLQLRWNGLGDAGGLRKRCRAAAQ
jgi:Ran GTPase-activating protein (RanGAP) involved in mRNA processing and transport